MYLRNVYTIFFMSEHRHYCNTCYIKKGVLSTCVECGGSGRVTYAFDEQQKAPKGYGMTRKERVKVNMDLIVQEIERKENESK
jgi:hypothetical protein